MLCAEKSDMGKGWLEDNPVTQGKKNAGVKKLSTRMHVQNTYMHMRTRRI